MKKYEIGHTAIYSICFDEKYESSQSYRYGDMKIPEHTYKVLELFDETRRFLKINIPKEKKKLLNQRYFWRSLTRFYKVKGDNEFEKLCEVIKINVYNIVYFARSEDWLTFFCEIYNKQYCRGSASKNKLSLSMFN